MIEQTLIELPGDTVWAVRGWEYPDADTARSVWEKIELETRGTNCEYSIWRTMDPDMTRHFVVVCGREEKLPVLDGKPLHIPLEHAKVFALRRAKTALDHFAAHPEEDHYEHYERYGEGHPMYVDRATGEVKPYVKSEWSD